MSNIINPTQVKTAEENEATYEKRKGKFLLFFDTEWWEKVSQRHIGNDIHIKTDREIRDVYLNGKKVNQLSPKQ